MNVFEEYAEQYDKWYDNNKFIYMSELDCVKKAVPNSGMGIEIGVGTGRFASRLNISYGVDPSFNMLKFAKERGIQCVKGCGEDIPFKSSVFDFAVVLFTLSFVKNPNKVFCEINRIVKKGGYVVCGIIDKDSFLGEFYMQHLDSKFYSKCKFLSTLELVDICKKNNILITEVYQTLFKIPELINECSPVKVGFGDGGYVVTKGINIKL